MINVVLTLFNYWQIKFQVRVLLFDRLRAIFLSNVNFALPPYFTYWQTKFGNFQKICFLEKMLFSPF